MIILKDSQYMVIYKKFLKGIFKNKYTIFLGLSLIKNVSLKLQKNHLTTQEQMDCKQ